MAEKSGILYSTLAYPAVYRLKRVILGGGGKGSPLLRFLESAFASHRHRLGRPLRILDVGCGEGAFAATASRYGAFTGIDYNPRYIDHARARYGHLGAFICDDIRNIGAHIGNPEFDAVTLKGVIHHLDDGLTRQLLDFLFALTSKDGIFVSVDPALHANQHPVARALVSLDRGGFVRPVEAHCALFPAGQARHFVTNFLRIPYTHVVSVKGAVAAPPNARDIA